MDESVAIGAAVIRPDGDDAPTGSGPSEYGCAQSSVASTTRQPYSVDCITNTTPCMLLYPIGRAGKTREVAKVHVDPVAGLYDGNPIPPLYACVRVQELLKTSYEDNEIDIPTSDGKTTLGECLGITILWHKRDIILLVSPEGPAHQTRPAPDYLPAAPSP